jgi:hypothetical protein
MVREVDREKTQEAPTAVLAFQGEVDDTRLKNGSVFAKIQDKLSDLSATAAGGAGFAIGLTARMPGSLGAIGKFVAIGASGAATSDALMHSLSATGVDNSRAYFRDGIFMTSLAAGFALKPRLLLPSPGSIPSKVTMQELGSMTNPLGPVSRMVGFAPVSGRNVFRDFGTNNIVELASYRASRQGIGKMIEESEIKAFSAETQVEIRRAIDEMVQKGHKARHLMLGKDGSVMLDREAASSELEANLFKSLKLDK